MLWVCVSITFRVRVLTVSMAVVLPVLFRRSFPLKFWIPSRPALMPRWVKVPAIFCLSVPRAVLKQLLSKERRNIL